LTRGARTTDHLRFSRNGVQRIKDAGVLSRDSFYEAQVRLVENVTLLAFLGLGSEPAVNDRESSDGKDRVVTLEAGIHVL
jgi:hypothetical protein